MSDPTFRELEHAGWVAKANGYDDVLTIVTRQAFEPILERFGNLAGKRFLDVACGPGHLAGLAARRGADSEGIDFASTMIERAKANYPAVEFTEGDAERLPYADSIFDAVTCAFGMLHFAQPEQAIREAGRVLKLGGRYTFTVWCSPDQGGDFFGLVMGAIQKYGTLQVPLPPAPPLFRFADPQNCEQVLAAAGFTSSEINILPLKWRATRPQAILDLIYKGTVRTPMLLTAQSEPARQRIHEAIVEGVQAYAKEGAIELGFPALMATAVRA